MSTGDQINQIIDQTTGIGELMDELTILRAALRLYAEGMNPTDAVARACEMLSNSITKHSPE